MLARYTGASSTSSRSIHVCGSARTVRERAQRHRLGRVARTDDADRARAFAGAEDLAPRDERAEDRVGEVGLRAHQLAERRERDDEHAPGLRDPCASGTRADRSAGSARRGSGAAPCVATTTSPRVVEADDLDLALEHDEEVGRAARRRGTRRRRARPRGSRRTARAPRAGASSSTGHATSLSSVSRSSRGVTLGAPVVSFRAAAGDRDRRAAARGRVGAAGRRPSSTRGARCGGARACGGEPEEAERRRGRGDARGDDERDPVRVGDLRARRLPTERPDTTGTTASAASPAVRAIALFTPDATLT